jgi:hypothetical protein
MSQTNSRNGRAAEPEVLDAAQLENEVATLRGENASLRARVEELEQLAAQDIEQRWAERQREYEGLLEEKSEVIRGLHQKIAEMRERAASAAPPVEVCAEELPEREQLLLLKEELDEQRAQMEQDEEALMSQMRAMEMALAKDRAELARQRAEVQRLHDELKRELENAARDGGLRDRLSALQRRAGHTTRPSVSQDTPTPGATPTSGTTKSGLFRRIFG